MDIGKFLGAVMTDDRIPKSNIAARFQNAFSQHISQSPPIGVFWDIENCQVPKGKSAIALVKNIRERFFVNRREAEFMCVCDINKESKIVIQELLFAQVTIVHISATSKNAADDKLKQCMKRYVDTHGSPSTLLLISDDVNFASDLSDFRHRHNIHIILVHRGHAHQSLLACAHEHYNFFTINQDLPFRSPVKSHDNRPNELEIYDLPIDRKESHIRNHLQKLSSNCGGKVIYVRGHRALIRFANADATEKAKKRMDQELVFGNRISVHLRTRDLECSDSPQRFHNQDSNSSQGSFSSISPKSSRDSSFSPPSRRLKKKFSNLMDESERKFNFPPPPVFSNDDFPSLLNKGNTDKLVHLNFCPDNTMSLISASQVDERQMDGIDSERRKSGYSNCKFPDSSAFSPFKKNTEKNFKKHSHRNIGRVSPFYMQENDAVTNSFSANDFSARHNGSSGFSFTSSDYCNHSQSSSFPFNAIQRISDPMLCSSQWNGTSSLPLSSSHAIAQNSISDGLPVELLVSNLDASFEVNEMKKALLSVFSEHVMVLHVSMSLQPDGTAKATVKVPTLQDAQFAISRLHRKKIGHKKILISHSSSEKTPPTHILKSETIALLNDIPAKNLPLIKFRELFEKRYHRPLAISELYKMREAVTIQGESGKRVVYLNADLYKASSLSESEDSQDYGIIEKPYCERHYHVSDSQGWAEQYSICPLPTVHISLKNLSPAVHMLLDTHRGSLPLVSFCACYEAEIGPLPILSSSENVVLKENVSSAACPISDKGVPLEHLIACVTGVEVTKSVLCFKKVQWLQNKSQDLQISQNLNPALMGQLTLFSREVMDLLKSQSQCLVPFNKFIPTYHHHFGRQCRVADYGFTKLIDLLESIPHIVQVLGEGQNRLVTLTHRTQVKRFAAELLRILKSRASKQISVSEFSLMYEQVIEKPFDITNYGVCEITDLLNEVPDSMVVISISGNEMIVSIPKRDQTAEEIERTKEFAKEVVELMKHTPCCTMSFNRFIPAYHHHFGKQCKVADYGFTKLIELFEVIPNILEVTGTGEDKVLSLVENERHKVISERLRSIVKSQPNEVIDINQIGNVYSKIHGHALRAEDFGFSDLHELLENMDSSLRVVIGYGRTYITCVDPALVHQISFNIRHLLMEKVDGKMFIKDLCKLYQRRFGLKINLSLYLPDMKDIIKVEDEWVQLSDVQLLARDIILLLQKEHQIPLSTFGTAFEKRYGVSICAEKFGFSSISSILESLSDYFIIKGKKQRKCVTLKMENISVSLPDIWTEKRSIYDGQSTRDILNEPIPSSLPSPSLLPFSRNMDLMGFETPPTLSALGSCDITVIEHKETGTFNTTIEKHAKDNLPLNTHVSDNLLCLLESPSDTYSADYIQNHLYENAEHPSSQNKELVENSTGNVYLNKSKGCIETVVCAHLPQNAKETYESALKGITKMCSRKNRIAACFNIALDS